MREVFSLDLKSATVLFWGRGVLMSCGILFGSPEPAYLMAQNFNWVMLQLGIEITADCKLTTNVVAFLDTQNKNEKQ